MSILDRILPGRPQGERRVRPGALPLAGARVLITGGGSGIGRLMALGAAERGAAQVIVWDLSAESAEAVAAEVRVRGAEALAVTVDVTSTDAVAEASRRSPEVDVVVNNAGVVTGAPLTEATEAGIRRTFEVNALAPYWVTRAFLPGMVERNAGVVVTVASAAGLVGVARQTDYSASKHAAVGFAESLRAELRKAGSAVRSLVVCPFYIDTGMFAGAQTTVPWLLPILEPQHVATKVLDAVESSAQQLLLPPAAHALAPLRVLPIRAFDAVVDMLGVNATMDGFTGRAGAAEPVAADRAADEQTSRTGR